MADDFAAFLEARDLLLAWDLLDKDLVCKVGQPPTLKLLKDAWTNDSHDQLRNTSGIFFSIWESTRKGDEDRLLYNIHALKMRQLQGYKARSREFAFAFRREFLPYWGAWPHVSTDYGPLTLMQGWIERRPHRLARDIYDLAQPFQDLVPVIDRLLSEVAVAGAGRSEGELR